MKTALFAILFLASAAVAQDNTSTTTTNTTGTTGGTTTNLDSSANTTNTNNTTTTTTTTNNDSGKPASRAGIGFHGGVNFNNFSFNNHVFTAAKDNRTGWFAGLHLEGWGWDIIAIRPEVNYSVRGYNINNVARVNHSYVEVPILLKFTPIPGPIKLFIEGGPQFSWHVNTTVEQAGTTTNYSESSAHNDFGLVAGAGLGFLFSDHIMLEFEARYDWGLKNLSDAPDVEIKTRTLQALAGITLLSN